MYGFRFIDLFAGIGGFRLAAEVNGGECVFSSEIDKEAANIYQANHGHRPHGDITEVAEGDIPSHDLILAGFPCQPFSISGFKKGFDDARGTLFFEILRIAKYHRPSCVILENVKHFKNHDGGRTISVVLTALEELGYKVSFKVINATRFGLPQNRERTIIIASLENTFDFSRLKETGGTSIKSILEENADFHYLEDNEYTLLPNSMVKNQPQSGLRFVGYRNKNIRKVGVREDTEHLSRVHKQPNRIYCSSGTHPTLSAGESSGRYWILNEGRVRKLTMRECYRLQGFNEDFKVHESTSAAYKQIGNSVPVPMIAEVIRSSIEQGAFKCKNRSLVYKICKKAFI